LTSQTAIPCLYMRGGTSKGTFFDAADLPGDGEARDRVLAAVMGGPDRLQIDGMGGGHPLSSKVAIISRSKRESTDVDYLFLQLNPDTGRIDTSQNCGNMLAAVGPFAIETGMLSAEDPMTRVRVYMINSGNRCNLRIPTPEGQVEYEGDTAIDGVPGTGAPILCEYQDLAGSATGAMLPSGTVVDEIDGIEVTLIDNGMPVVIISAEDLGVTGHESTDELEGNKALVAAKESIRLQAGEIMGLGDVTEKTVPKICLVSAPQSGGHLETRTFIPHACHKAIGVLGAVSVATACLMEHSVAGKLARLPHNDSDTISDVVVEHPSGSFHLKIRSRQSKGELEVLSAGVLRTARMLFRGEALVPRSVWRGFQRKPVAESAGEARFA
jgi:4-oxalomesaconate tautomerase